MPTVCIHWLLLQTVCKHRHLRTVCNHTPAAHSSLRLLTTACALGHPQETRIFATIIMLAAIGLTLTSALYWKNTLLCIIFVAVQFCAVIWYTLSFIPFARSLLSRCLTKTASSLCDM
jgi:hypothetical protein